MRKRKALRQAARFVWCFSIEPRTFLLSDSAKSKQESFFCTIFRRWQCNATTTFWKNSCWCTSQLSHVFARHWSNQRCQQHDQRISATFDLAAAESRPANRRCVKCSGAGFEQFRFDYVKLGYGRKKSHVNISRIQFAHGSFRDAHKLLLYKVLKRSNIGWIKYMAMKLLQRSKTTWAQQSINILESRCNYMKLRDFFARNLLLQLPQVSVQPSVWIEFSTQPTTRNPRHWLEPYSEGKFIKFVNNNGKINRQLPDNLIVQQQKVEALVHFNYEYTHKKLMLLDVQGSAEQMKLYDPKIATKKLMSGDDKIFLCAGNFKHGCN